MEWKSVGGTNVILKGDGFYISYQPRPADNPFTGFGSLLGVETSTTGPETALCTPTEPKWRILNGDFRHEYEQAFPLGLEACVAVYEKHKAAHHCDWSTDEN